MQVATDGIDQQRVKADQAGHIVAGGTLIGSKACVRDILPDPGAVRAAAWRKEQVAVDDVAGHHRAPAIYKEAGVIGVDDIVLDEVVARVILNIDFAAPVALGIVIIECIVHDDAVLGAAAALVITAQGNPNLRIVVNKVVAGSDIAGVPASVFTCQFDRQVGVMDDITIQKDACTTIYIDAIRAALVAVGGI